MRRSPSSWQTPQKSSLLSSLRRVGGRGRADPAILDAATRFSTKSCLVLSLLISLSASASTFASIVRIRAHRRVEETPEIQNFSTKSKPASRRGAEIGLSSTGDPRMLPSPMRYPINSANRGRVRWHLARGGCAGGTIPVAPSRRAIASVSRRVACAGDHDHDRGNADEERVVVSNRAVVVTGRACGRPESLHCPLDPAPARDQ